jgi:uncharacterized protein (DUF427 family)
MTKVIRITHRPSNILLAEGPKGWGITPFEGNYYISRKYLKTDRFKINYIPGICFYKFLYVWMDLVLEDDKVRNIAWMYWLPNPLFPFIAFRVAVPGHHPQLLIEELEIAMEVGEKAS